MIASLFFAVLVALSHAQSNISTSTPVSTTVEPTQIPTTTSPPLVPVSPPTWTVKSSNSTCILLRGNFTFAVTYSTPEGSTAYESMDIPTNAKVSGSCGPFINSLVLTWDKGNLTFMFIRKPIYDAGVDTGSGSYSLATIFGRLTVGNTTNGTSPNKPATDASSGSTSSGQTVFVAVRQPEYMSTPMDNSYSCESYQSISADGTGKGNVNLEMRGVQVEAFHKGPNANFSESQPCSKDTMSSLASVVGYTVLAVLVAAGAGYLAWKKFGRGGYTQV